MASFCKMRFTQSFQFCHRHKTKLNLSNQILSTSFANSIPHYVRVFSVLFSAFNSNVQIYCLRIKIKKKNKNCSNYYRFVCKAFGFTFPPLIANHRSFCLDIEFHPIHLEFLNAFYCCFLLLFQTYIFFLFPTKNLSSRMLTNQSKAENVIK